MNPTSDGGAILRRSHMGARPDRAAGSGSSQGGTAMNFGNLLHWAIIFLVIALVAGLLGFGGLAGTAMEGARLLFWVAIVLVVVSLVFNFMRRGGV